LKVSKKMELFSGLSVTQFHVGIGVLLFCIGVSGFLIRRSGLIALMCLELMLNGVNLCLVSFSNLHRNPEGASLVLFIVLVAAAEAAVALGLFVAIFRKVGTVSLDDLRSLKG
jgi:NADH-quinone oxidoreductase subunit K